MVLLVEPLGVVIHNGRIQRHTMLKVRFSHPALFPQIIQMVDVFTHCIFLLLNVDSAADAERRTLWCILLLPQTAKPCIQPHTIARTRLSGCYCSLAKPAFLFLSQIYAES